MQPLHVYKKIRPQSRSHVANPSAASSEDETLLPCHAIASEGHPLVLVSLSWPSLCRHISDLTKGVCQVNLHAFMKDEALHAPFCMAHADQRRAWYLHRQAVMYVPST